MQYVTFINLCREIANQLTQSLKEGSKEVYQLYHTRYEFPPGETPLKSIMATIGYLPSINGPIQETITFVLKDTGELTKITSVPVEGKPDMVENALIASDEQTIRENVKRFFKIQ